MYLVEIHGKLSQKNKNKEDILTSNVFSFFKYADRELFLTPFLKDILNIELFEDDTKEAEFIFWPRYDDNTEPDLVIIVGDYYLLFEAKYFSGFGRETKHTEAQLIREIEGGVLEANNLDRKFMLVAITAHYSYKPEVFTDIPKKYRNSFRWVNWQSVAGLLQDKLESDVVMLLETRLFAGDLYQLLLQKNLKSYEGTAHLLSVGPIKPPPSQIFFASETAQFRGDFIGFSDTLQFEQKLQPYEGLFFDRSTRKFFSSLNSLLGIRAIPGRIFYDG